MTNLHTCRAECSPRAARHGFTLIELLVVVAVITVLLSVLLPSLSGARIAALQAASSSNMRRLGIAMHQYMDDNDDMMPRVAHSEGPGRSWIFTLRPYIEGVYAQTGTDDASGTRRLRASFDRIRLCPADPLGADRLANGGSSYILNYYVAEPIREINPIGPGAVIADYSNRRRIAQPSETHTLFIIADGASPAVEQDHTEGDIWFAGETAALRWETILADIEPGRFGGDPIDAEDQTGGLTADPLTYERRGRSSYLFFDAHVKSIDAEVIAQFAIADEDFALPR